MSEGKDIWQDPDRLRSAHGTEYIKLDRYEELTAERDRLREENEMLRRGSESLGGDMENAVSFWQEEKEKAERYKAALEQNRQRIVEWIFTNAIYADVSPIMGTPLAGKSEVISVHDFMKFLDGLEEEKRLSREVKD